MGQFQQSSIIDDTDGPYRLVAGKIRRLSDIVSKDVVSVNEEKDEEELFDREDKVWKK